MVCVSVRMWQEVSNRFLSTRNTDAGWQLGCCLATNFSVCFFWGEIVPNYDYGCSKCNHEFEVSHGMNDKPRIRCPECGSAAKKLVMGCGFIVRNSGAIHAAKERAKAETDMRSDLNQNYGVEQVSPVGGNSFSDVYKDVKQQGSLVRDQMQQKREENAKATKAKQKAWLEKAHKRAPRKAKIRDEMRAKEDAAKRSIRLTDSK